MKKKSNKKAFTLLEVMLATVILLITSLMMVQGFMSTLTFSANTAVFAKAGGNNTQSAYAKVAEKKGVKDIGAGSPLSLTASGYDFKVYVQSWSYTSGATSSEINAGAGFGFQEANGPYTVNRHVVTYVQTNNKQCPNNSNHAIARNSNDAPDFRWYCTECSGNPYI